MNVTNIPVVHVTPRPEDIKSMMKDLPEFPAHPDPDEHLLQTAILRSGSFSDLLRQLYPTWASNLFAAGLLVKRMAKGGTYRVGPATPDSGQSVILPDEPVGIVGDLEVDGDLRITHALVVTGNLKINGAMRDSGPESRVVALGDLSCEHINTNGSVLIGGNLDVRGVILGDHPDDVLEALGDINAGIIITYEHDIEAGGSIRAKILPEEEGAWGSVIFDGNDESHIEQLNALIGEDVIDDEYNWNYEALRRFIP